MLLVLDEGLPRAVAPELRARGRDAASVYELGLAGATDAELLAGLAERGEALVLVTADDQLPLRPAVLGPPRPAMAVLDPPGAGAATLEAWRRETVARWAHVMQRQRPGTLRRYGPAGYGPLSRGPAR